MQKKKIAIIGIQGLPNKYGGFETLADYLTKNLREYFDFIVFCSSKKYESKIKHFNGATLKYLPFDANGSQSILYDCISILLSLKYDKILILGASGGILLPLLKPFRDKFILNFGGLDWQRSKWSRTAQIVLKKSEEFAVKNSSKLISDNEGIKSYLREEYGRDSSLIEYGGDQAKYQPLMGNYINKYHFINDKYIFSVARVQPDNNIEMILKAFNQYKKINLVFVGNWNNSEYGKKLKVKYNNQENIFLLDAIYDQKELDALRSNCILYIHGHSAGGTNPSLVEAMNLSLPIIAFASTFNKYTTENKGLYFKDENDLIQVLNNIEQCDLESMKLKMKTIASKRYKWSIICNKYKEILQQ